MPDALHVTVARGQHRIIEDSEGHTGLVVEFEGRHWALAMAGDLQVVGSGSNGEGAVVKLLEFWADERRRADWERH